jgi:hypothetical protein
MDEITGRYVNEVRDCKGEEGHVDVIADWIPLTLTLSPIRRGGGERNQSVVE